MARGHARNLVMGFLNGKRGDAWPGPSELLTNFQLWNNVWFGDRSPDITRGRYPSKSTASRSMLKYDRACIQSSERRKPQTAPKSSTKIVREKRQLRLTSRNQVTQVRGSRIRISAEGGATGRKWVRWEYTPTKTDPHRLFTCYLNDAIWQPEG